MAELTFMSNTGDHPVFFVPDTGVPGATATIAHDGADAVAIDAQPQVDATVFDWGDGLSAPRLGFEVAPLAIGTHVLTISQEDRVDVYTIEVTDREDQEG